MTKHMQDGAHRMSKFMQDWTAKEIIKWIITLAVIAEQVRICTTSLQDQFILYWSGTQRLSTSSHSYIGGRPTVFIALTSLLGTVVANHLIVLQDLTGGEKMVATVPHNAALQCNSYAGFTTLVWKQHESFKQSNNVIDKSGDPWLKTAVIGFPMM